MKINTCLLRMFLIMAVLSSCQNSGKKKNTNDAYPKGTFGYDLNFIQKHQNAVLLQRDQSRVLIDPEFQGRVLTSSAGGADGRSFGWINYSLIESGKTVPHFNNYGGEERLWLGPEGGQFSLFFPSGAPFTFENWQVPALFDTDPFELVEANDTLAIFRKEGQLTNYNGFQFSFRINRSVQILERSVISKKINLPIPESLQLIGYESTNELINTGSMSWDEESGLLSIWMLGQLISSPTNVVLIPYQSGPVDSLGQIVKDDYFGKVPADRLKITEHLILFKADGLKRSKIGLNPRRAKNYLGSYDYGQKVLTVVFYSKPEAKHGYVNSMWKMQEKPYEGDVINSYNDGPLEDGTQLGPFYELETSSPAAALKPGESIIHTNLTIHLTGSETDLEPLIQTLFGLGIEEIKHIFAL